MRVRRLVLIGGAVGMAACRRAGSIEGTLMGDSSAAALPLSGQTVYLLPASAGVGAALRGVCPAGGAVAWQQAARAERERFAATAAAYRDSSRDQLRRSGRSAEWMRLRQLAAAFADSVGKVQRQPPTIGRDLVAELATTRAETGPDGRFTLSDVAAGSYLLAVEIRAEFEWRPVQVGHTKAVLTMSPGTSTVGCEIAGKL
jgi:hypothetical protein